MLDRPGAVDWEAHKADSSAHHRSDYQAGVSNKGSAQINIFNPATVQGDIDRTTLFSVHASLAPKGITLLACGIKTDVSSTYQVEFEIWNTPGSGAVDSIEVVATSGSLEAEDDGTLTTSFVDEGQIVMVDLPATAGVTELHCWITFLIN